MAIDMNKIELEHLDHLRFSGYDFVCSKCNQVYKEKPVDGCYCGNKKFLDIGEVIRKLEFRANIFH